MTTTGISRPDGATKVLTESTIISYLGSPAFNEDPFPAYRFYLNHPGWPSPSGYRCGRVQRLPPVHSQRESRPPMTCARSSASRLAIKE